MDTSNQDVDAEKTNKTPRTGEKVIQPTNTFQEDLQKTQITTSANPAGVDVSTVYPQATASVDKSVNASHEYAKLMVAKTGRESNRPVCLRVKTVLVIGVLLIVSTLFTIAVSLGKEGGEIVLIIGLVQAAMAFVLLFSKDHHTVSLLLKIFLVIQIVNLFMSLAEPVSFIMSGIVTLFLAYTYYRVKSLSYS